MAETLQKYELLALLPLTATEEELKAMASRLEDRIKAASGTVVSSSALQKGRLAYPVSRLRQGYYQMIQFEMEPKAVAEFRRVLLLSGETLRASISRVHGEFKVFIPSTPKAASTRARFTKISPSPVVVTPPITTPVASPLAQEAIKPEAAPKVTMEELDKRLEEILGES